jgi:hypothetical protein
LSINRYIRVYELVCKSNQRVLWPPKVRLLALYENSLYGVTTLDICRFLGVAALVLTIFLKY